MSSIPLLTEAEVETTLAELDNAFANKNIPAVFTILRDKVLDFVNTKNGYRDLLGCAIDNAAKLDLQMTISCLVDLIPNTLNDSPSSASMMINQAIEYLLKIEDDKLIIGVEANIYLLDLNHLYLHPELAHKATQSFRTLMGRYFKHDKQSGSGLGMGNESGLEFLENKMCQLESNDISPLARLVQEVWIKELCNRAALDRYSRINVRMELERKIKTEDSNSFFGGTLRQAWIKVVKEWLASDKSSALNFLAAAKDNVMKTGPVSHFVRNAAGALLSEVEEKSKPLLPTLKTWLLTHGKRVRS